jgi:glucose/mannose-6-phosphate isomerase
MTILDQLDRWSSLDPQSMYSLIDAFPEQIQAASKIEPDLALPDARNAGVIIVSGLGGSAIGGDLARSIAGPELKVPLIVNRDYNLPAFAGSSSLVLACSYSGNTEETLSAYQQAHRLGARIVCITSGGKLDDIAKTDGCPVLRVPGGLPPRAALGYSLFSLLTALQGVKAIPDIRESICESIELLKNLRLRYGAASPESGNAAKTVAHSLAGRIVAVYGSGSTMDAVAFRWRTQIEENAKNLALHNALPEMNHNELVGWKYPEEVLRHVGVVMLRDKADHPQVQRRFDLTRNIIAPKAGALHVIWSEGNSLLARIMSCIYLGDFVSLYMAYLNNTDPTPVEVIDFLKNELAHASN